MCRLVVHAVITNAARNVCARRWIERELIMELGGDEKKIQALFSDLSLEDQSRVPQFGHLWARAQAKKETAAGSLGRPLAVLVSLLVTAAACSLAVWTWYTSTQTPNIVVQLPPPVTSEARYTPTRDTLVPVSQPVKIHIRPHRNTTGRR